MIEAKGLYKGYGGKEEYVVKDVDIHVEPGTIHGLIGHNGSGKTTIIKCLTGIYQPDKGEVKIGGGVIFDNPKVKDKVGYVADSNQMFSTYRVKQLVKFYERIFPDFSKEEFQRLNNIFKVSENKRISQLSKGQQMRVSFMLNMARKPEVLILDEPTSGLDAMAKKDLLDILVETVEDRGMTVLISSHHLSELEKICDSITMIEDGKVRIEDELDEVRNQVAKYQVVFKDGAPEEVLQRKDLIHVSNVGSVYTMVLSKDVENFVQEMLDAGALMAEQMQVGLEESFVYMNREKNGGGADE